MMMDQDQNSWGARLVDAACSVVGAGIGVPKITVVETERLPYDELARLRDRAAESDTDFVMEGDGTVIVQRADHRASKRRLFAPSQWSLFKRTRSPEPSPR
jgi:hypothetical protein